MVPIKEQIAGIIAREVNFRLNNPEFTASPKEYERLAQDIIDRVIDDGQYACQDAYDDMCSFDCTVAHNALWYKLDRLEERFDEEHGECDCKDIHNVLIDEIIALGDRIEKLEQRLDEAKKAHHNHALRPWENKPHQSW